MCCCVALSRSRCILEGTMVLLLYGAPSHRLRVTFLRDPYRQILVVDFNRCEWLLLS